MKDENKKRCFVVGPIGSAGSETRNQADLLLAYIIRPALEPLGYTVKRADDEKSPGDISAHVINSVLDADLVVGDLTGHNANVFYELGIRHMIEKPVIHMIMEGQKLPFDVSTFNTIPYSLDSPSLHKQAAALLLEHAQATESGDFKLSNPITAARGHQKLALSTDPMEQTVSALVDAVAAVREELDDLRTTTEAVAGVPLSGSEHPFYSGLKVRLSPAQKAAFEVIGKQHLAGPRTVLSTQSERKTFTTSVDGDDDNK